MSKPSDIDELLLMRTEQRDQFEAECQRLRRELVRAQEELHWAGLLVAEAGVSIEKGVSENVGLNIAVDLLNVAMLATGTDLGKDGHELDAILAIGRKVRQLGCCHNASAQKVDGDVSLVCSDCGASAPLFGVMQRLLEGKPEEKWPHGPPLPPDAPFAFVGEAPPVANIVAGQIGDDEYAAVIESVDDGVGTGGPIVPSRNDEPHNYHG